MKNRHYQDMLCAARLTAAVLAAVCISQPIGTFAQELSLDAAVVNIGEEPEEQTEAQELTGSWSVDSAWVQTKAEDEEERWMLCCWRVCSASFW